MCWKWEDNFPSENGLFFVKIGVLLKFKVGGIGNLMVNTWFCFSVILSNIKG